MAFTRSSGILLHPTSFPGDYGIGSLDDAAIQWLDWLQRAGQKLWQILPLGHTGYGDSPYQSFSAFAGNPLMVSVERLRDDGLLDPQVLTNAPDFPRDRVDFGWIFVWKWGVLREAHRRFRSGAAPDERTAFNAFRDANRAWLTDYALFMALKDQHEGRPWTQWPEEFVHRDAAALDRARRELAEEIELYEFVQYEFFKQWGAVRAAARERGIQIIGDIPIFVAHDSADVWGHQDLFFLEPDGSPSVVAGVPPDYFSETGQLWGNPHYRWDVMKRNGFRWWLDRIRACLALVDIVRIDHFRGFEAYWEVPGGAATAEKGRWVKAPGEDLFRAVEKEFGEIPIIAEDLGVITPEVEALRDEFNLPGMKILQFAFYDGPDDPFLPHTYEKPCVAYTGTHDNDTTRSWWALEPEDVKEKVREYLDVTGEDIVWDMIRAVWRSRATFAVTTLQDALELGNDARMNLPGSLSNRNWSWRYRPEQLTEDLAQKLRALTEETQR